MAEPKIDPYPESSESDGRWRVAFVPAGSNPLSVAILKGSTAKDLTYSFTPDGFVPGRDQTMVEDPRFTSLQDLTRPGKFKDSLDLKFVASKDPASADVILTDFLEGFIVFRAGEDNSAEWKVGDKVTVMHVKFGKKSFPQPVANGVDVKTLPVGIIGPTQDDVALVA